ncbi:MAG: DNA endonuclease SmrA [Gammaproteobacteria bacterium]|nr:DNA endonuclease SmrA [Gammaproteobacteria bacterium]
MVPEGDLFKTAIKLLGGVEPLAKNNRNVALNKPSGDPLRQRARRQAAIAETSAEINPLSGDFIDYVTPTDTLAFKRCGVQNYVYREFRLGKLHLDARLDLHRHTVEMARQVLFEFIRHCLEANVRCALITHGKGEGRKQPRLKSCVNGWLPQMNEVLAFHSAQIRHGGPGATYILLRKAHPKYFSD